MRTYTEGEIVKALREWWEAPRRGDSKRSRLLAAIDRGWRMFCQSCGTDAPGLTAKYVVRS